MNVRPFLDYLKEKRERESEGIYGTPLITEFLKKSPFYKEYRYRATPADCVTEVSCIADDRPVMAFLCGVVEVGRWR